VFLWNLLDLKRVRWEGDEALASGRHNVEYDFKYDGLGFATLAFNDISGLGRGGTGTLKVDGKVVAAQTLEHTVPLILMWDETFDKRQIRHAGERSGLPSAILVLRQDRQADNLDRAAEAHARGY
jgi:hypothetical protein